jgi:hypothetical protein
MPLPFEKDAVGRVQGELVPVPRRADERSASDMAPPQAGTCAMAGINIFILHIYEFMAGRVLGRANTAGECRRRRCWSWANTVGTSHRHARAIFGGALDLYR